MSNAKKRFPPKPDPGGNPPNPQTWTQYGSRLIHIRGAQSQAVFAPALGIHKNTLGNYERGEREVGADTLRSLVYRGWNANWVLTGEGPERLDDLGAVAETRATPASQDMSPTDLSMAIQLANEKIAASGLAPTPEQYGQFVLLLYQVLVGGLPTAEVLDFPR